MNDLNLFPFPVIAGDQKTEIMRVFESTQVPFAICRVFTVLANAGGKRHRPVPPVLAAHVTGQDQDPFVVGPSGHLGLALDVDDAFPYDPNEWIDSDEDGIGDNGDEYPYGGRANEIPIEEIGPLSRYGGGWVSACAGNNYYNNYYNIYYRAVY